RSIYEYHVSLLSSKIYKTHKKLSSVVSPVSVSPNKYASLVVEDVCTQCTTDCADTTASLVSPSVCISSKGVPAMGSAPEVKLSVLNSLPLSNKLSPFPVLASEEPESHVGY